MDISSSWHQKLKDELALPYMQELEHFLDREEQEGQIIYPPRALIFNAFSQVPFDLVKVVIIGQDPYHGEGQAQGLSFSVPSGVHIPPSLKNIFLELKSDLNIEPSKNGCLTKWAEQGVLLLNAILTVRAKAPKSHHGKGWERFTDAVVRILCERADPVIFVLWGKSAQEKWEKVLKAESLKHVVLTAPHPSPYSAHTGFLGCRHFSTINRYLIEWGKDAIEWGVS